MARALLFHLLHIAFLRGMPHGFRLEVNKFHLDTFDLSVDEQTPKKASAADVTTANKYMESVKETLPLLSASDCQVAMTALKHEITGVLQDSKRGRYLKKLAGAGSSLADLTVDDVGEEFDEEFDFDGKPATISQKQTVAIKERTLAWQEEEGQACLPFEEALLKKVATPVDSASLAETGAESNIDFGHAALLIEFGIQGVFLGGHASAGLGIVVLGKRAGTIVKMVGLGVETTIVGAGLRIGLTALRHAEDLNEKSCGLAGKLEIPGPVKLFSVGFQVIFRGLKFNGIAIDAVVGPSLELPIPIGAAFACQKTTELLSKGKGADSHR